MVVGGRGLLCVGVEMLVVVVVLVVLALRLRRLLVADVRLG